MGNTGFSTRESQIILIRWRSFIDFICKGYPPYMKGKHLKHRFDNSQTEGFVVTLCDRFT